MLPSGIKIRKEQLNILAYADGSIVLIGINEIKIRQLFLEMKYCYKFRTTDKPRKKQNILVEIFKRKISHEGNGMDIRYIKKQEQKRKPH
jgi:hypothetical protein